MSKKGATTWNGVGNEPGWESIPTAEVAGPPGWNVLSAFIKGKELRIHVEPKVAIENCSTCGAPLTKLGFEDSEFVDSPQREWSAKLIAHQQQYECAGPIKHYPGNWSPGIDSNRRMTVRARNGLRKSADRTDTANAEQYGISDKTVAAVHKDYATQIAARQRSTDKYIFLIFDEKVRNGKKHFQMTDGITHTLLEFLDTNDPEEIKKVLLTYENREFVKYISLDFTGDYESLFPLYPNARPGRDPFHLFGNLHLCREAVRKDAYQRATEEGKPALRGRLGFWQDVNDPNWIGQQQNLFGDAPLISEANLAYLRFRDWWYFASDSADAAKQFEYWVKTIPEPIRPHFQNLIDTVRKYADEVFLYHDTGITSGPGEGANRNIQREIDKGRNLSDAGLDAKMKVREERKRRQALLAQNAPSELDINREAELSVENSKARSERMKKILEEARKRKHAKPTEETTEGDTTSTEKEATQDHVPQLNSHLREAQPGQPSEQQPLSNGERSNPSSPVKESGVPDWKPSGKTWRTESSTQQFFFGLAASGNWSSEEDQCEGQKVRRKNDS